MAHRYRMTSHRLRQALYERMADEWGMKYDLRLPVILGKLCGRRVSFMAEDGMSEEETAICQKLLGEHGYAYYKALLIQRGMDETPTV